ncbi:MAG: hypothetical protein CO090_07425 [Acidobacteria bacterium CG_4_9_14_3_um_filter_49_7]|nr:MAG: hypothetical protein CO090_07425 [Acidobacteria bacterium CG_4_9_14_3_um_filter_49_7]
MEANVRDETHLYLGRHYRLRLVEGSVQAVKLTQGRIEISLPDPFDDRRVKTLLESWYREKSMFHFQSLFDKHFIIFSGVSVREKPLLRIRNLRTRWGSISDDNVLTLNLQLIRAPRECIEYVIVHELCHLKHHNHNSEFYMLLEKHLPGWKRLKSKLELSLS